jgi:translation elongation factor EF-Tu-like GTPase
MRMGFVELADGQQVNPGDTIEKDITLLIFPAVAPEIRAGWEWRIQEGGKLVAIGSILEAPLTSA